MNRYFLNAWQSINKLLLIDIYFNIIIRKTKLIKYFVINNKILKNRTMFFNYNVTLIIKKQKRTNNNLKYVRGLP